MGRQHSSEETSLLGQAVKNSVPNFTGLVNEPKTSAPKAMSSINTLTGNSGISKQLHFFSQISRENMKFIGLLLNGYQAYGNYKCINFPKV